MQATQALVDWQIDKSMNILMVIAKALGMQKNWTPWMQASLSSMDKKQDTNRNCHVELNEQWKTKSTGENVRTKWPRRHNYFNWREWVYHMEFPFQLKKHRLV